MLTEEEALAEVIRAHLPRDRYDEDGGAVSTYCTGCDWEGDYLADGEAGPFDDHLANVVLASAWLAAHDASRPRPGRTGSGREGAGRRGQRVA